jgi:predicted GNAT family acetyltransferase
MEQTIRPHSIPVRQDTKEERFYFQVEGAENAHLDYKLHTDGKTNTVEFTHTFLPEHLRDTGLAEKMALEAIRFADKNDYKVKPTCPFVRGFLENRPQFHHLLK